MQSSLAIVNGSEWGAMFQVADALVKSGFLPQSIKTPQQAVAIILAGRELGIGPWQAVQTINVIQGKPTISPQLMLALINRSGELEDMVIDGNNARCTVTMTRKGRSPHSETFTMDEANKMGVGSKPTWKSIPATMLRWRAVAACARVVFPDVILGVYTPDEMGADVVADEAGAMTVVSVTAEPEKSTSIADAAERFKQNSAQHGGPTTREPGQTAEDDTFYTVRELSFQAQGKTTSCVLKAADGTNIVIYSSNPFRDAGVTDEEIKHWKNVGTWKFTDQPIRVWGQQVRNSKNNLVWQVERIDMQRTPEAAAEAAAFANI